MEGFLSNNWFFIVLLALCCLGHLFGHGAHGDHRHDKGGTDGEENSHHKRAA
jgi:hypothetical protein